jgi:hypothetical protein
MLPAVTEYSFYRRDDQQIMWKMYETLPCLLSGRDSWRARSVPLTTARIRSKFSTRNSFTANPVCYLFYRNVQPFNGTICTTSIVIITSQPRWFILIAQNVSLQLVTTEARVQSQANPRAISCEPSTTIKVLQFSSISIISLIFTRLTTVLYYLCIWVRR